MALSDPIIQRRGDRLTIRLPARPAWGWAWVLAIPYAAPLIAFGGYISLASIAPQVVGAHVTNSAPAGFKWVANLIAFAFGGCFVLLGGAVVAKSLISRFGRSEIVLTRGRLRNIERLGFIFFTSSRSLTTLTRLDIVKPPTDEKTDGDPLMNLEAYFSDANPFGLAKMYPAKALRPIARELVGAIPDYGGSTKVIFAGPPPLSPMRNVPMIVPPTQRKGELSRLSLDRSGGTTRVTIPPYPWGIAILPPVVALAAAFPIFRVINAQWHSNASWETNRNNTDLFPFLYLLVPLAIGLAGTLLMRLGYVFEASCNGLRVEFHSPLRCSVKYWPAAEIDQLVTETRTVQTTKGGSNTICELILILKSGDRKKISGARGQRHLEWICQTLTAGLQQAGISPASKSVNPNRPTFNKAPPRGVGIFFALFSCIFFVAGWSMAIKQDLLLRHALPVQATVTSIKTVATSYRGGPKDDFTTWRYRYCVNGRWYESDNLFATETTGTSEQGIRDRFLANVTQGQSIPAWYEPGDPSKVFVVRERAFSPYFFIFLSMVFIAVGLSIALRPRMPKDCPADAPAPIGLMRRRTQALFWTLSGAAAIGHYLLQWPTTWHMDFLIIAGIWLIVSITLLNWWRLGIVAQTAAPPKAA